jgi:hypothetical protein
MLLPGNAGVVMAVSSMILAFVGTNESQGLAGALRFRVAILARGLAGLWTLVHSRCVDDRLSRIIACALKRWTELAVRDDAALLHLSGDYAVVELAVGDRDRLAGSELADPRRPPAWSELPRRHFSS